MLDWLTIPSAFGVGAVIGAFVTQALTWFRESKSESRRQQREAVYAALQAAIGLEAFVSACDGHLKDRAVDQEMGLIKDAGKLPRLADHPSNVDWRCFDTGLASEVLGFPARINSAQNHALRASWERGDHWESEPSAIVLANAAWQLASRIRQHYRLAPNESLSPVAADLEAQKIEMDRKKSPLREELEATLREGQLISGRS